MIAICVCVRAKTNNRIGCLTSGNCCLSCVPLSYRAPHCIMSSKRGLEVWTFDKVGLETGKKRNTFRTHWNNVYWFSVEEFTRNRWWWFSQTIRFFPHLNGTFFGIEAHVTQKPNQITIVFFGFGNSINKKIYGIVFRCLFAFRRVTNHVS